MSKRLTSVHCTVAHCRTWKSAGSGRARALLAAGLCGTLCCCSDAATVATQVNLLQAPAGQSEVMATIPRGSVIKVRDCTNGWCRASWNGHDGYILSKKVRVGDSVRRPAEANRQDSDYVGDEDSASVPDASGDTGPSD